MIIISSTNIEFKERHKFFEHSYMYRNILLFALLDKTISYDKYSETVTVRKLAKTIGFTVTGTYKQLKQLETMNVIQIEHDSTRASVITVNHYSEWIKPEQKTSVTKKHKVKGKDVYENAGLDY